MKRTITIGHFPIIDHLVLGVAAHNEGNDFEHFNLTTERFEKWDEIIDGLMSGKLDGAFILFPLALKIFREGAPIKIVLLGQREGQVLVAKKGISKVEELKDKLVHIPNVYSVHNIILHELLKQAGLTDKDIQYKVGFESVREMAESLRRRETQAFISAEPWGTLAKQMGAGQIIATSADVKTHHTCCVLVLRDELIDESPQVCEELVKSLVKAGMFMSAYPRQAAEIGAEFLGHPRQLLLESLTHHRGHVLFWDLLPRLEDFRELQNIAVNEMHMWPDAIDLQQIIDATFAQKAYREWMIDLRQEVRDRGEERTLPGNFEESTQRVRKHLLADTRVLGLQLVEAGDRFPQDVPREAYRSEDDLDMISGRVLTGLGIAKGMYITTPVPGFTPERVLLRLLKEDFEKVNKALSWGRAESIFALATNKEALLCSVESVYLSQENAYWCSVSYTQFRFLGLLFSYYNS